MSRAGAERVVNTIAPIGFVGVGNMGGAMALRVLAQGGAVVAFDLSPDARRRLASAGATVVDSPSAVAQQCDVISVVVNYDADVVAALLGPEGVLAGAAADTVVAIHSTVHLETLERVAREASTRSVAVVDATVTGGVDAAARGELAVLLGGDRDAVDRVRVAIAPYASVVMHAGGLGAGMAAKLSLMVVSFGKMAATYEGLRLAHAAGVDVNELAGVIAHSEQQSGIHDFFLRTRARTIGDEDDDSFAPIARHESPKSQKDLHAALELAHRLGLPLPVTTASHDAMPAVWGIEG